MNFNFEPGDNVVACFGDFNDFHPLRTFYHYKTQIGVVRSVSTDKLLIDYEDGICFEVDRKLFSPVKIITETNGNEIYRIHNVAGGYTYISDIGFGTVSLYDTCMDDMTTMLLIINDVAQERRKEQHEKLIRQRVQV